MHALAVDQLVAWGALYYAYPVLAPALAHGLGLSRTAVAAAFSLGLLVAAAAAPITAWVATRVGARAVLRGGGVAGVVALSLLGSARGTLGLIAGMVALGLAQSASLYEPAFAAVVALQREPARRERSLLTLTVFGGFASTVFLPSSTWLLSELGWRATFAVLAVVFAIVAVVARGIVLPDARGPAAPKPAAPKPSAQRASPSALAPLTVAFAVLSFVSAGVSLFLVPALIDDGWSAAAAALVGGAIGAMQVPARIAYVLFPRALVSRLRLGAVVVAQAVGLAATTEGHALMVVLGAVLYGGGAGVATLARATTLLDRFGPAAFPLASGITSAGALVARALAPFVVEVGHRRLGLRLELAVLTVLLVVTAPLVAARADVSRRASHHEG